MGDHERISLLVASIVVVPASEGDPGEDAEEE
jgi:hypothetical protein